MRLPPSTAQGPASGCRKARRAQSCWFHPDLGRPSRREKQVEALVREAPDRRFQSLTCSLTGDKAAWGRPRPARATPAPRSPPALRSHRRTRRTPALPCWPAACAPPPGTPASGGQFLRGDGGVAIRAPVLRQRRVADAAAPTAQAPHLAPLAVEVSPVPTMTDQPRAVTLRPPNFLASNQRRRLHRQPGRCLQPANLMTYPDAVRHLDAAVQRRGIEPARGRRMAGRPHRLAQSRRKRAQVGPLRAICPASPSHPSQARLDSTLVELESRHGLDNVTGHEPAANLGGHYVVTGVTAGGRGCREGRCCKGLFELQADLDDAGTGGSDRPTGMLSRRGGRC
jgi:hypothetical protein